MNKFFSIKKYDKHIKNHSNKDNLLYFLIKIKKPTVITDYFITSFIISFNSLVVFLVSISFLLVVYFLIFFICFVVLTILFYIVHLIMSLIY